MSKHATVIVLTPEEQTALRQMTRRPSTERRFVERARIIEMAAAGKTTQEIALALKTRPARVSQWRTRFASRRMDGLQDLPRPGQKRKYDQRMQERMLALLGEPPPSGYATWSGPLLSEALGDVPVSAVWQMLREQRISLQRRRSWCISTDPEFASKAADIVGLYLAPPKNAVVISVDEKPSIQALERAQGWLRMPNGRALTGFSHQYKRHGTTTLFAALEVATGIALTAHHSRRRRREFLQFMNHVVAQYPNTELHVILDNLNTHKPKNDQWLRRHPLVHFHYTPTSASWLNQVECWFSILSRRAIKGASFTSSKEVREGIDRFTAAYNENAAPFEWHKEKVYQKSPKGHLTLIKLSKH
jgi:transposase